MGSILVCSPKPWQTPPIYPLSGYLYNFFMPTIYNNFKRRRYAYGYILNDTPLTGKQLPGNQQQNNINSININLNTISNIYIFIVRIQL